MSHKINDELYEQREIWLEGKGVSVGDIQSDEKGKYVIEYIEGEMTDDGLDGSEKKIYLPANFQELV